MPEFLNILLQKSDPYLSWGFDLIGGREYGLPLTICEVSSNSFSSQYLSKGDEIIRIEGVDASLFTETEASSFIRKPSKSLDLVIYKRSKENSIYGVNRAANESPENNSRRPAPARRELNLKSNFQCYFAVPEKKLTRLEKRRIYKRSSSVPPPTPCEAVRDESCGYDGRWRVESVRDRSPSPPFWRCDGDGRRERANPTNSRRFWRQMETGVSDAECDHEVARYCRASRWCDRSSSVDSNFDCKSSESSDNLIVDRIKNKTEVTEEYKYRIPVQFDYYEHKERQSRYEQHHRNNVSKVYLSPYDYRMQNNIIKSLQPLTRGVRRQTSQTSDKGSEVQTSGEHVSPAVPNNTGNTAPPAPAPAPPPPPPPSMNGCIPTIRLKSEISDRCEPPAKLHNAMMKDKKPFTYTPGGIDLSEIKSPRMQRRIVRNAQTPDDVILPPSTAVNTNSLPPSAMAAMTPQIAIPVFPQNGLTKKSTPNPPPPPKRSPVPSPVPKQWQEVSNSPPPPPQKQQIPRTVVVTKDQEMPKEQPRVQVGSLYVPPVSEPQQISKPAFPTLREAPTPWLQKHQQPQEESKPAWVNRNKSNGETEQKQVIYERKPRVQQVQVEKETVEPEKPAAGTRVIPIQLEGANQTATQPNSRQNSQRWVTDGGNQTASNNKNNFNRGGVNASKSFTEPDSKPIQSRSFKVLQKITGSEDDTTDFSSDVPYNTEGVPLSQLRRLHLCDDDQAFMNKVKSQVDEDIFLHTETDPRYRGSAIPSKAFRMLQNMTESGQVIPTTIEVQGQAKPKPNGTRENENEPQKKYIPPSERQAEQEFRKYMGSSIPSRSFRMLQAMTATQDTTTRPMDESDF